MKRFIVNSLLLVGLLAFSFDACKKVDEPLDPIEEEVADDMRFNIEVERVDGPSTRLVKTDWEVGDKIFIFFKVTEQPYSGHSAGFLNETIYVTITWDGSSWVGAHSWDSGAAGHLYLGTAGTMYAVYFPFGGVYKPGTHGAHTFLGSGHTSSVFNGQPVYSFYMVDEVGSPYTMGYNIHDDQFPTLTGTLHMKIPDDFVYFYIDKQGDDYNQNEKYRLSVEGVKPATVVSWTGGDDLFEKEELGAGKPMWGYKYGDGIAFSGIRDNTWATTADHKMILFSDGDPALTKTLENVSLSEVRASVNLSNPLSPANNWEPAMTAPSFRTMGAGGLKWGNWNLGATGLDEYGTPFAWGEIVPYSGTRDDRYSGHNLTGDYAVYDVARAYLGNDWRMPTDSEFGTMSDGCAKNYQSSGDVSWGHFSLNGLVCSSNEDPQNSILFQTPDGANGVYWTSTSPSAAATAIRYWIYNNSNDTYRNTSFNYEASVVRPVYIGSEPDPDPPVLASGLFGSGTRNDYQKVDWGADSSVSDLDVSFNTTDNVYVYNTTKSALDNVVLHPHSESDGTYFEGYLGETYEEGDHLQVFFKTGSAGVVDYSAQNGSLASVVDAGVGSATVATAYITSAYKMIATGAASIDNLQSVFRFEFRCGENVIDNIRFVRIFSGNNKLQTRYDAKTDTPTYGPITISRSDDLENQYIFAGLRFDTTPDDPIIFQLFDKDGKAYSGSMNAPSDGFVNGKYYVSTVDVHLDAFTANSSGKRVCFSPGDYGAGNTFSEPFVGLGNPSYYYTFSEASNTRTVAGVPWRIPDDGIGDNEMTYILNTREMPTNVSRSYRVYIKKSITIGSVTTDPVCCLLIPPDGAALSDAEISELSAAGSSSSIFTDYLKFIGKGFVLLTRTSRYDNGWKSAGLGGDDGIYRTRQSKRCIHFGPSKAQCVESYNLLSNSNKARVRYIHTVQ